LLFMIPADSKDIREEYEILLNEIANFNPELLDKHRVLAITKSDMLDEELTEALKADLPGIPYVFISSVTGQGITELKDILWEELNKEDNKVASLTHRNLDLSHRVKEEDELLLAGDDDDEEEESYEEYDWDE